MPLAWLPYADAVEAERRLGGLPDGVDADWFLGDGHWPERIEQVEFVVLPYQKEPEALARAEQMSRLKVLQTLTAGVEQYLPYVPPGVTLCNAAGVHDASTAELAVALALAVGRQIDVHARHMPAGVWQSSFGASLAERRVLVLGYGRIGAAIERRLDGFEIASLTRVARRARNGDRPVHAVAELDALLPDADVVFVVAPHTRETTGILGAERLALLPDQALVVNVARGALIDTDALVAETSSGRLRAALDVTDPEPLPPEHPLWRTSGVLITPHVGGPSSAFFPRADRLIAAQLGRFARGEELENVIT